VSDEEPFNWDNETTVVIRPVKAVAVYRNPYNEIVIRQESFDPHDEDHFVHVPQGELRKLIEALQRQIETN
jgi:hypothetical protein